MLKSYFLVLLSFIFVIVIFIVNRDFRKFGRIRFVKEKGIFVLVVFV